MQLIQDAIDEKLKIENNSRTFHAHSLQHFMTQSNVTNVVSVTSPKTNDEKENEQKREQKNNDNMKRKNAKKECNVVEDIKLIKMKVKRRNDEN